MIAALLLTVGVVLLPDTVIRTETHVGAAFEVDLPVMGADLDNVVVATALAEHCLKGRGEIRFIVTRGGRPYAEQARVFSIARGDRTVPSMVARALCRAGLKIVHPTH